MTQTESYDLLTQRRGDSVIGRWIKTFSNLRDAKRFAQNLNNLPADTIHYAITRESDGKTEWNTKSQGLLPGIAA